MDLAFYKLRLCDSDILLVDDLSGEGGGRDWSRAARLMLQRKRGAGADRFAVLSKVESQLWLRVYDPKGEVAAMGDAALCAARYLLDSGRSGADTVSLKAFGLPESDAGSLEVDVLDSSSLGIEIGKVCCIPGGEALEASQAAQRATVIESGGEKFQVLPLRLALPPQEIAVIFANGGAATTRARIESGRSSLQLAPLVVQVISREELSIAASTSKGPDASALAAAALAAASSLGYAQRECLVRMRTGALWAEWADSGALYVAGRPEYVYRGEYHLGEDDQL